MVIERPGVEGDDEHECREIQRIVHETLIEETDRVYEDADRRYGEAEEQVTIPDALYHFAVFRWRLNIGPKSFSKLFVQRNNVSLGFDDLSSAACSRQSIGKEETEIHG